MDPNDAVAGRDAMVSYLATQLIGPVDGPTEILFEPPHRRYAMGVLFPREIILDPLHVESEVDGDSDSAIDDTQEFGDDAIRLSSEWYPSSVGLSFYVRGNAAFDCAVSAGRYAESKSVAGSPSSKQWTRSMVPAGVDAEVVTVGPSDSPRRQVLGGEATLQTRWRVVGAGHIVTVALVNSRERSGDERVAAEDCLYQVQLEVRLDTKALLEYPSVDLPTFDEEESEIRLLYRSDHTYAVGHGCAASWTETDDATVLNCRFLPIVEIPPTTSQTGGPTDILRLATLADPDVPVDDLCQQLREFADDYAEWRGGLDDLRVDIPEGMQGTAAVVLDKIDTAIDRMRSGIDLLGQDDDVLVAFRLANRAMLMQMRHGRPDLGGAQREPGTLAEEYARYLSAQSDDYLTEDLSWYPFQLAFLLLVLDAVTNEDSEFRDVVDLLWFPTGGGKTEAYFAISAFEIFFRRMRFGQSGGGLTVLTRYTMRLLTTQQFQRAASLICASELLRREGTWDLGDEPISVGLWVGQDASPNRLSQVREMIERIEQRPQDGSPFPLQRCPWCGSAIVSAKGGADSIGVKVEDRLVFHCLDSRCPFHGGLPVSIVDEDIYRNPPTYMLATVDKFAQLAYKGEASVFFGGDGHRGPSLLIQDEFHLLTGPLGTTAGIYEHAIGIAFKLRGVQPKVLASTATIRRSNEQSQSIFGRPVSLFPPSGLSHDDAYYRRTEMDSPGRLYVGVLAPSHTFATAEVFAAAALLQAPIELDLQGRVMDGFSSLVIYHNTKRELGRTLTLARDDIPARISSTASDSAKLREIEGDAVVELTGNVGGDEIPRVLSRIERRYGSPGHVSVLATTNMISVGVDVPRLALMLVAGQPKTASEYIQATSRVGRSDVAGLVVTLMSSTRPRDRSHYEGFTSFHSSVYQHVEPTSVTPFSLASRHRALAACLVIIVRHGLGLWSNDDAGKFQPLGKDGKRIRELIVDSVKATDLGEADETRVQVDMLLDEWDERIANAGDSPLFYHARGQGESSLIRWPNDGGDAWPVMLSMRAVEPDVAIDVRGETWSI